MNKRKANNIISRLLLLFFVAGQIIIYAHQHHAKYYTSIVDSHHSSNKHTIVQEKCNFCDQMHHNSIQLVHKPGYQVILTSEPHIYYVLQHHYKANSLIHADGLSPPALV